MTERSETMDTQPAKRQKVDVACDLCRSKKIKCDSVRPVCGPCMKKKNNSTLCSWEGGVFRNHQPSRAEMLRLRRRIQELESSAVNQADQTTDDNANIRIAEALRIQSAGGVEQNDVCAHVSGLAKVGTRQEHFLQSRDPATPILCAETQDSTKSSSVTDRVSSEPTLGSVGCSSINGDFFGDSSALSFLSQVRNAVHQKLGIAEPTTSTAGEDIQTHVLGAPVTQTYKSLDYVLPGRRQADKLLSVYWDRIHPLYPFLDKQEFLARYETLWIHKDSDEEDPVYLCALNLVFALSSGLNKDIPPSERQSSANVFFERAKGSLDFWHLNTLQSVQMLLLLSIYLQSVCALNQSWMIIGVAIRTAQSLGLHLYGKYRQDVSISHERQDFVRRVWHTCVLLDRLTAMTQGRPPMTTASMENKGRMSPIGKEEFCAPGDRQSMPCHHQPSDVDFFSQSLRLFGMSDEILWESYPDYIDMRCSSRDTLEMLLGRSTANNKWSILDTDRKLLEWDKRLPSHLKVKQVSSSSDISCMFARQAIILRQQFLHIRLLSLRPILSAYLSSEGGGSFSGASTASPLSKRIAIQCSVACVDIAREMIDISYSGRPSDPNLVGVTEAWWHNVLFIYSAATVLIAAKLSPSILSDIPEASISESWHRANDVLKCFQVSNPTVQRMVEALHIVHQIIPENYARLRKQHVQHSEAHPTEIQNMSIHSQGQEQGVSAQDLLHVAQSSDRQMISSFADCVASGDTFEHGISFDVDDFSWLTTIPFEL